MKTDEIISNLNNIVSIIQLSANIGQAVKDAIVPLFQDLIVHFSKYDPTKHWTSEEIAAAVMAYFALQAELIKPFIEGAKGEQE